MSPRAGGEADKFGNRYEGVWTVRHLLYVLLGYGDSVKVEDIDELGKGAEFTYRRGNTVEVHQVKRQNGNANSWNVKSLKKLGIWENAKYHIDRGREFHFVSVVSTRSIQELTDRARSADSLAEFISDRLTRDLKVTFDELSSSVVYGSAHVAWSVLRGLWTSCHDENELVRVNSVLAEILLSGASGRLAAAGLGDLIDNSLGSTLDETAIHSRLEQYDLQRSPTFSDRSVLGKVKAATATWADSIERELLHPVIKRSEADKVIDLVGAESEKLTLLMGAAGCGKSATLHQVIQRLREQEIPVLGFRLDRLEPFTTTRELGSRVGLDMSPVAALATVAHEQSSVLIIDQLDAVSLVSGRMPRNFDAVADLVREASAFPRMQVLLACRKFDVENDHRIRMLVDAERCENVEVQELTESEVDEALAAMGLDVATLSGRQRKLLRSPLHLVLLRGFADDPGLLEFQTPQNLFDAFWQRKLRDCVQRRETVRFHKVVSTIAEAISDRQRLSVPITVLDRLDLSVDADVLVSERVLVRDGQEIAFFHESFFDYTFARGWVDRNQSLEEFLTSGEQELFRRAQVRQILSHLRELEPDRFSEEVEETLTSPNVRFHVKDMILSLLHALTLPTAREWEMIAAVLETHPSFEQRLWRSLRTGPWFECLDRAGIVEEWLSGSSDVEKHRAVEIMAGATSSSPDRLAEILRHHRTESSFANWLRWIVRFADLHASRALFELLLAAIRTGEYNDDVRGELWLSAHGLAHHQPVWAAELLAAYLIDRPDSMALASNDKIAALQSRDHSASEMARVAAEGAPESFCTLLLPYVLDVMEETAYREEDLPILDRHFSNRYPEFSMHHLDEVIFSGIAYSIRYLVKHSSPEAQPALDKLATSPYESAQWLLYEALRVEGQKYAEWAVELLLEGPHRFLSGYTSNSVWAARQLIQAVTPFCSSDSFEKLEAAILAVRFPWESRRPGWYMFNLLSGMDESRLSVVAKRRLGELRRAAGSEQPHEPEGIVGGAIASPIPADSAKQMSDDHWLRAITKHDIDKTNWREFTGGAHELSSVLQQEAERDPARFARLSLRLSSTTHMSYVTAILTALGSGEVLDDPSPVFDSVRHIATLGHGDTGRWFGFALRPYYKSVPLDVVEILVDHARRSTEPPISDRAWSSDGEDNIGRDVHFTGINSARGALVETLGDLLLYDSDGSRTSLVVPILSEMAADSSLGVRSCAAHLIQASMRHARGPALDAFSHLVATDDDRLFATGTVIRLIMQLGYESPELARPVIEQNLHSSVREVRKAAGHLSAFAGLQWGMKDLLDFVVSSSDPARREGAARLCAHMLPNTEDAAFARQAFESFMDDPDASVQKAVGEVAGALRGKHLRSVKHSLTRLISSASFTASLPQLFITLQQAPDRVDDLVLECSRRFIEIEGADAGDIRTSAAADARYVGELLIRAYAQALRRSTRRKVLDVIDQLLEIEAFGVAELVEKSER
ncbi:NACHT domain-containing protein [Streptomyces nanshensis]|uniref:ATPase AAA-type core domain-containing protein n=1 Tax=Streptomyces nanshensis TaxID=518642 RepID=A0A1E7L3W7_9ACTN|nr:ATP-binding protein [Streptomyces nanshensis]OEV10906.1 hypothetical protein AN218_15485 [Streptomyces nanshensis]